MRVRSIGGQLSNGVQQALAIGLLVVVAVLIWAAYASVSGKIAANDQAIAERREQLGRMLQIANWQPAPDEPANEQLNSALQSLFSPGDASAVSLAEFQARLKKHAAQAGAQIVNVTERPVKEELGFSWIGLRISVIGRFDAVARFVTAVESATPYTTVFSGRVTSDPDLNRATTPEARLDAQLEFYTPVQVAAAGL